MQIHVTDKAHALLCSLSIEAADGMMRVLSLESTQTVEGTDNLSLRVDALHANAQYMAAANHILLIDKRGVTQYYNIVRVDTATGTNGSLMDVYCEGHQYDLLYNLITASYTGASLSSIVSTCLTGSSWAVGNVDGTWVAPTDIDTGDVTQTLNAFTMATSLKALQDMAAKWKFEFSFRVTWTGSAIANRYVDVWASGNRGTNRGLRVTLDTNASMIRRTQDVSGLFTRVYGRGNKINTLTDGTEEYADFADAVWTTAGGDPINKALGYTYVEDTAAQAVYGIRTGVYEESTDDIYVLLRGAYRMMVDSLAPRVSYDLTMTDFAECIRDRSDVSGWTTYLEAYTLDVGDTVTIVDSVLNMATTARVLSLTRNWLDESRTQLQLGNYAESLIRSLAVDNKGPKGDPGTVAGQTYWFHNESSDIGGYEQLLTSPNNSTEVTEAVSVSSASDTLIDSYATNAGVPNLTSIPIGDWDFGLYGMVDNVSTGDSRLVVKMYKRTSGGTETLLFEAQSDVLKATVSLVWAHYTVTSNIALLATDRLVAKVYARSTSATTRTVTWYYEGQVNTSSIRTSAAVMGSPGSVFNLELTGGIRAFTWVASGSSFAPAATAITATLYRDGSAVTPTSYAWTTSGTTNTLVSGTGSASTFTPTITSTWDAAKASGWVACAVVYAGVTYNQTIPIACSRIGDTGSTGTAGKTYALSIDAGTLAINYDTNGANPSPATATAFSCTLYEDGTSVTPTSYAWSVPASLTVLSGSSASATFTPTIASTYTTASWNNKVMLTVVYAGKTIKASIAVAVTQRGAVGPNLDWVTSWDGTAQVINGDTFITPKLFAGTNSTTGIYMGWDGKADSACGIIGYANGVQTFAIGTNGSASFKGNVDAQTGTIGNGITLDGTGSKMIINHANLTNKSVRVGTYDTDSIGMAGYDDETKLWEIGVTGNTTMSNLDVGTLRAGNITENYMGQSTIYVNASTGNDNTGTGGSAAPYATLGRACLDVSNVNLVYDVLIAVAPGTYVENVLLENMGGKYTLTISQNSAAGAVLVDGTFTGRYCSATILLQGYDTSTKYIRFYNSSTTSGAKGVWFYGCGHVYLKFLVCRMAYSAVTTYAFIFERCILAKVESCAALNGMQHTAFMDTPYCIARDSTGNRNGGAYAYAYMIQRSVCEIHGTTPTSTATTYRTAAYDAMTCYANPTVGTDSFTDSATVPTDSPGGGGTTALTCTNSDTYRTWINSWRGEVNQVYQGSNDVNAVNQYGWNCGVMWFTKPSDFTASSTLTTATLKLYRNVGIGSSGAHGSFGLYLFSFANRVGNGPLHSANGAANTSRLNMSYTGQANLGTWAYTDGYAQTVTLNTACVKEALVNGKGIAMYNQNYSYGRWYGSQGGSYAPVLTITYTP